MRALSLGALLLSAALPKTAGVLVSVDVILPSRETPKKAAAVDAAEDQHEECAHWAAQGECGVNADFSERRRAPPLVAVLLRVPCC